jgi:sodium transport system permease protein
MSAIYHIIKKELTETLRDKRTLMTMIVIPILLFPVLLSLIVRTQQHFSEEASNKKITIAFDEAYTNHPIINKLQTLAEADSLIVLLPISEFNKTKALIQQDSIQAAIYIDADAKAPIVVWHDGTKIDILGRITEQIESIKQIVIDEQMQAQNIEPSTISGFEYQMMSTASTQETVGKLAGGLLPYIFIVFGFLGCMYPAIDLFTGEKERGTIETLLTAPIARWKILVGKMSVVVISGLLAASLSLLGLYISIRGLNLIEDPALLGIINSILSFKFITVLFLLQVPLTIFFAGLLIPIAIHAKSFKEAQSIITPLNFVVILPAMIGFLPQIELNATTALIPIVNIVLATKELIAGTLNYMHLLLSAVVMCLIAAAAVFISYKQFEKENNVLN